MKKVAWVGAGALLGLGAALMVAAAHSAPDASAYGQIDLFSAAFSKVRENYVDPVPDKDLVKSAVQGMVSALDPHSAYMDAKSFGGDFQSRTQGRFGGVGIQVTPDAGMIRVVTPMDGMPAAAAGIKAGDRITAINGKSVAGQDFNEAINTMRGPVGTKVTLTVERQGEKKPFEMTLVRADVPIDATTSRREGDVGYIRMPGFNEKTADGLEKAVKDLKKQIGPGIKGYVLDLRNNPGGLLDQAIQVSDDFLNSGEIVSTRGRRPEDTQRYDAKPGDITDGKPIVVLINGGTASASEIVSGALQDHKRATILGMTSFGKGSVQTVLPLGEGRGALRLTTARYYTPSGHSIQAQGIIPDLQVAQGDEASLPRIFRYSEADLQGHLAGEPVPTKRANAPVIYAAPGTKYDDFQLAYALDLLRGKMTVASVTKSSAG
ncbi:MAG TPA: S41 family peptidase [Rhizomicrobium sp.]|nr:S41 family peptidase [Rhizomicrobium sp.]